MKSSEQADFKTDLTFHIWWGIDGGIAKNKIKKFPGPPFIFLAIFNLCIGIDLMIIEEPIIILVRSICLELIIVSSYVFSTISTGGYKSHISQC